MGAFRQQSNRRRPAKQWEPFKRCRMKKYEEWINKCSRVTFSFNVHDQKLDGCRARFAPPLTSVFQIYGVPPSIACSQHTFRSVLPVRLPIRCWGPPQAPTVAASAQDEAELSCLFKVRQAVRKSSGFPYQKRQSSGRRVREVAQAKRPPGEGNKKASTIHHCTSPSSHALYLPILSQLFISDWKAAPIA
jgi:hypothetical protein